MNVKEYLDLVAYKKKAVFGLEDEPESYLSRYDDSYITLVGMEDKVKFLADREITEKLKHGTGYSPKSEKWYGWSHRAIYGFEIGSTCKKGDCHYVAATPEGLIDDHANFFADISQESADQHRAECQILPDRSGIRILHTPTKLPMASNLEELTNAIEGGIDLPEEYIGENDYSIIKCGRGEWIAKTMEDAREMAIAFNRGVS